MKIFVKPFFITLGVKITYSKFSKFHDLFKFNFIFTFSDVIGDNNTK